METKKPSSDAAIAAFSQSTPVDGALTVADLIVVGTQSIGITKFMPGVVMPVVVDTNVLIEDLLRRSDGKHSSLLVAAALGSARIYATQSILAELDRNLPRIARERGRDLTRLREVLARDYLPHLRVVYVGDLHSEDDRVKALALEDADDVGPAKLALLLSPSFLLTTDKDHLRHGLGVFYEPTENKTGWTFGAVALQDRGIIIGVMAGGEGGAMGGLLAGELAVDAAKAIAKNEKLMTVGLFVIVGIAIFLAVSPRARERLGQLIESVALVAGDAASSVARGVGKALDMSEEAHALLEANATRRPAPDTELELVARVLAVSHPGVTLAQLREALPTIASVESVLGSSRLFVEVQPGRWALGRSVATLQKTLPSGAIGR
jgi:predicted nucleic acid-binding protein